MSTQQGQDDGKRHLAYEDEGEVQTRAVMSDTLGSIA